MEIKLNQNKSKGIKMINAIGVRYKRSKIPALGHLMSEQTKAAAMYQANPFTPAFGTIPSFMAGRKQIIQDMGHAFDKGIGSPDLCSIFIGARGTGKTALLSYLSNGAESKGWISVNGVSEPGLLEDIYQQAQYRASHLMSKQSIKRLTGIEIAPLGSISWENGPEAILNWRSRMTQLLDQLADTDTGLLITVDEVDPSLDEITQLANVYQLFVREGKKVALLMAGLPHKISALLTGKTTSFLRRATQNRLGNIPSYEVTDAFRLTVESAGKSIDDDALELAVDTIGGFPYMFQLLGYRAWNASGANETLALDDIKRGAKLAKEELENRVFEATLMELSHNDLDFLQAMARIGEEATRSELMESLGRKSSHISTYKKRLLDAGVIDEPKRGAFSFALPGFREYILEQYN